MWQYLAIVTIMFLLTFVALCIVVYRAGFIDKILVKLGVKQATAKRNWAVFSWNNMLEKLNYQADIVFFGDSIIRGSDFQKNFPDQKIVNLGYSGDTLAGMIERVPMLRALNPKKIFILAGINGLTDKNYRTSASTYGKLLNSIKEALPDADIYIHSLLPLSLEKQKQICKNETIQAFNRLLSDLASERSITFIDLYALYEKEGVLNPDLTVDGIHLHPHSYEPWASVLKGFVQSYHNV